MDERLLNSLFEGAQERAAAGDADQMTFSDEEAGRFKKAFADPEFRKMFAEYMDEMQDPAHRQETEAYISQLESEQKVPEGKELIRPRAGFVVKTKKTAEGSEEEDKLFLNIVQSEKVTEPSMTKTPKGDCWSVPYTVGPPHMEKDKKGDNATCFDVCFHPRALALSVGNRDFKELLVNTAMDGVEEMFKRQKLTVHLERRFHVVKGIDYKQGQVLTMMIAAQNKATWSDSKSATAAASPASAPPSSGKKTRSQDPPASSAEDEALVTASPVPSQRAAITPEPAKLSAPTKKSVSGGIKKGFLNSPKASLYPDKLPTVRPSGASGLIQEVKSLGPGSSGNVPPAPAAQHEAVSTLLQPPAAPTATAEQAVPELKAVSSKRITRSTTAPTTAQLEPALESLGPVQPVVLCKHREEVSLGDFDVVRQQQVGSSRPTELVYEILLPLAMSASKITLDLSDKKLALSYLDVYKLDLDLPYRVLDQQGKASFDKTKKALTVRLPVVQERPQSVQSPDSKSRIAEEASKPNNEAEDRTTSPVKPCASTPKKADNAHNRWVAPHGSAAMGKDAAADPSRELQEEVQRQAALAKQRAKEMAGKSVAKPIPVAPASLVVLPPTGDGAFVECATFSGAKAGYIFRRGELGVGYYRELSVGHKIPEPVATIEVASASVPAPAPAVRPVDIPFEVRESPKAVALLLNVPSIVPDSVQMDVSAFRVDVCFDAVVVLSESGHHKVRYAQSFVLDQTSCPGGLDANTAKFDAMGKNAVLVACKATPSVPWLTDGAQWLCSAPYELPVRALAVDHVADALRELTIAQPAVAQQMGGPERKKAAVAEMVTAAVSAMQFNTDALCELD